MNNVSAIVIPGLLAVLGTVVGGVVDSQIQKEKSEREFQSNLILESLKAESLSDRVKSLNFLVESHLISEPSIRDGLKSVIQDRDSIPQFGVVESKPVAASLLDEPSAREELVKKYPELQGKPVAIVGFTIRSGDIVDAITPLYSVLNQRMELLHRYEGLQVGKDKNDDGTPKGEAVQLYYPGYVVTGVDVTSGTYYGGDLVAAIQVTWTRMTSKGLQYDDQKVSKVFGSNAEIIEQENKGWLRDNLHNLHVVENKASNSAFYSDFIPQADHRGFLKEFLPTQTTVSYGQQDEG